MARHTMPLSLQLRVLCEGMPKNEKPCNWALDYFTRPRAGLASEQCGAERKWSRAQKKYINKNKNCVSVSRSSSVVCVFHCLATHTRCLCDIVRVAAMKIRL